MLLSCICASKTYLYMFEYTGSVVLSLDYSEYHATNIGIISFWGSLGLSLLCRHRSCLQQAGLRKLLKTLTRWRRAATISFFGKLQVWSKLVVWETQGRLSKDLEDTHDFQGSQEFREWLGGVGVAGWPCPLYKGVPVVNSVVHLMYGESPC